MWFSFLVVDITLSVQREAFWSKYYCLILFRRVIQKFPLSPKGCSQWQLNYCCRLSELFLFSVALLEWSKWSLCEVCKDSKANPAMYHFLVVWMEKLIS